MKESERKESKGKERKEAYTMPMPLALAFTTERIEFLRFLNDEQLRKELDIQLIRDLIEDRIKLRQQVIRATDALTEIYNSSAATLRKFSDLQDYLEGRISNEEREEKSEELD